MPSLIFFISLKLGSESLRSIRSFSDNRGKYNFFLNLMIVEIGISLYANLRRQRNTKLFDFFVFEQIRKRENI